MTQIIHPVARLANVPAIGTMVEFDAPSRLYLGKVAWHTDFRFTDPKTGREYWGTAFSHGGVELLTWRTSDRYGWAHRNAYTMAAGQRTAWREAIAAEAASLIREARSVWWRASYGSDAAEADAVVAEHYRRQREEAKAEVSFGAGGTDPVVVLERQGGGHVGLYMGEGAPAIAWSERQDPQSWSTPGVRITESILLKGDPLDPACPGDLIAQIGSLDVGQPVPEGWRVLTGNAHTSQVARVVLRAELEA